MDLSTAQRTDKAILLARLAQDCIETGRLYLERAGQLSDLFIGAELLVDDSLSDVRFTTDQAVQAVKEFDVEKAYGERPSQVALVADGASL